MVLTKRLAAKPPGQRHRKNSNPTQRFEQLETRTMLSVATSPRDLIAPQWFETIAPPADRAAAEHQTIEQIAWNGGSATVRSDEWIVQVADSRLAGLRSVADVAGLLPPAGFDFQVVRGLGRAGQVVIRTPGAQAEEVGRWLARSPNVESFGPNQILSIQQVPNDTDYGELWGLNNTGQWWGTPGADISAEEAWDLTRGSATTVVGVIDTGIDYNHPDLYGNVWINQAEIPADRRANLADLDGDGLITFYDLNDPRNQGVGKITDLNGDGLIGGADILVPWQAGGAGGWADGVSQPGDSQFVDDLVGWNFVNNTNDPYDDQSHGSHVSGTIAGMGNNDRGVAGVSWKASVMALKSFNSDGYSELADDVRALNYATMQRTQFGVNIRTTNNSWGWEGEFDQALYDAIAASGAAGMLFVAAAGNSSADSDALPHYPAAYNLDNIVSVAATDSYDAMAYFSNYGATTVDLAAPGDWIYSSVPGYSWYPDTYSYYSGTSMATPHVVGVAALAWTLVPGATPAQVKAALMQGVDRLPDVGSTHTVTDGRLNARRTLELIRAQANQPPTIGSLTASPNPVPVGSVLTLTASSVADSDGTVANVKFYRESNGVPGLQAGSGGDLLLATDAVAPYQASVSTTGLTPGSYTYYAVATDNRGATSAVRSAASTVIAGLAELSIDHVAMAEGNSGKPALTFRLWLTAASNQPVTVRFATSNGTATAGIDYLATSGTLTFAPGEVSKLLPISLLADTRYENDETFSLNLSGATGAVITKPMVQGTILNDDARPSLRIADVSVRELASGSADVAFQLTLSAASDLPVTVNFTTANGTAGAGSDYGAVAGSITIPAGVRTATIYVPVLGDTALEPDETFFLNLSNAVNATIADAQGAGKILNDDASIAIGDVSLREGQSGATAFTFTVTLSAATPFPVTVRYRTADGTAIAGTDYTALALSALTFNPGETRKTVTVAVRGDATVEANETFKLVLSDPTNAVISRSTGLGTILNDDATTALSALLLGGSDARATTAAGLPTLAVTDAALDAFGLGGGLRGRPARGRAAVRLA
jgi:subtilisin family serine protease